jgi:hypothetical protein
MERKCKINKIPMLQDLRGNANNEKGPCNYHLRISGITQKSEPGREKRCTIRKAFINWTE